MSRSPRYMINNHGQIYDMHRGDYLADVSDLVWGNWLVDLLNKHTESKDESNSSKLHTRRQRTSAVHKTNKARPKPRSVKRNKKLARKQKAK